MTVKKHYRKLDVLEGGGLPKQPQTKTFAKTFAKAIVPKFVRNQKKTITGRIINKGVTASLATKSNGLTVTGLAATTLVGVPVGLAANTVRIGLPSAIKTGARTAGMATGFALAGPKAAIQAGISSPLALGRALLRSPGTAYNKIRTSMARGKITRRIGFDQTQILSKLNKFSAMEEAVKAKQTALETNIITRQGKIDPEKIKAKEEKYKGQLDQIEKQRQQFMATELDKQRTVKEKGGVETTGSIRSSQSGQAQSPINVGDFTKTLQNEYVRKKQAYNDKVLGKHQTETAAAGLLVADKQKEISDMETVKNMSLTEKATLFRAKRELKSLQAKATISQAKLDKLRQTKSINAKERKLAERKAISNASTAKLKAAVKDIYAPITTLKEGAQAGLKFSKSAEKFLSGNTGIKSAGQTFKNSLSELGSAMVKTKTNTVSDLKNIGTSAVNGISYLFNKTKKYGKIIGKSFNERTWLQSKKYLGTIKQTVDKRLTNATTKLANVNQQLVKTPGNAELLRQQRKLEKKISEERILKAKIEKKLSKSNLNTNVAYDPTKSAPTLEAVKQRASKNEAFRNRLLNRYRRTLNLESLVNLGITQDQINKYDIEQIPKSKELTPGQQPIKIEPTYDTLQQAQQQPPPSSPPPSSPPPPPPPRTTPPAPAAASPPLSTSTPAAATTVAPTASPAAATTVAPTAAPAAATTPAGATPAPPPPPAGATAVAPTAITPTTAAVAASSTTTPVVPASTAAPAPAAPAPAPAPAPTATPAAAPAPAPVPAITPTTASTSTKRLPIQLENNSIALTFNNKYLRQQRLQNKRTKDRRQRINTKFESITSKHTNTTPNNKARILEIKGKLKQNSNIDKKLKKILDSNIKPETFLKFIDDPMLVNLPLQKKVDAYYDRL